MREREKIPSRKVTQPRYFGIQCAGMVDAASMLCGVRLKFNKCSCGGMFGCLFYLFLSRIDCKALSDISRILLQPPARLCCWTSPFLSSQLNKEISSGFVASMPSCQSSSSFLPISQRRKQGTSRMWDMLKKKKKLFTSEQKGAEIPSSDRHKDLRNERKFQVRSDCWCWEMFGVVRAKTYWMSELVSSPNSSSHYLFTFYFTRCSHLCFWNDTTEEHP